MQRRRGEAGCHQRTGGRMIITGKTLLRCSLRNLFAHILRHSCSNTFSGFSDKCENNLDQVAAFLSFPQNNLGHSTPHTSAGVYPCNFPKFFDMLTLDLLFGFFERDFSRFICVQDIPEYHVGIHG